LGLEALGRRVTMAVKTPVKFHRKGLWALAAFILLLVVATEQTTLSIVAVVAAGVVLELLTWRGAFGRRDKSAKSPRPEGPTLYSGS